MSADAADVDADGIEELRAENERLRAENEAMQEQLNELTARVDALASKVEANTEATAELQSRELEKGAHLRAANVEGREDRLTVDGGRVERFQKDAGEHVRIPASSDPLGDRGGETTLAHSDLLPIQQLAQMDEDLLQGTVSTVPDRLAAHLWRERVDGAGGPWRDGSGSVRQYVDSSELRSWIQGRETVNREYAQKLAQRTMDALRELSRDRVFVERRQQRKNGLTYRERRLVLPSDADLPGEEPPGEATAPGTDGGRGG